MWTDDEKKKKNAGANPSRNQVRFHIFFVLDRYRARSRFFASLRFASVRFREIIVLKICNFGVWRGIVRIKILLFYQIGQQSTPTCFLFCLLFGQFVLSLGGTKPNPSRQEIGPKTEG